MHNGNALQHKSDADENHASQVDIRAIFDSIFDIELATSQDAIDEVFSVRYQVYCIDRPFEDPAHFQDKKEHDAYDPQSSHALIRHKATGHSVATVRLVMTGSSPENSSLPMEEACVPRMSKRVREEIANTPRERIAEISRMAVSREFRKRLNEDKSATGVSDQANYSDRESGKRAVPYISLGLLAAIMKMSAENGITHWMAIMEPAQLRLLKRFGVEFDYVGPLLEYHGLRRPAFTSACTLIDGIKRRRPDVWALITDEGRYTPARDL